MKKKKTESKALRLLLSILAGMLFMVVVIVGFVFIKARDFYNSSNYVENDDAMDGFINLDELIQNAESIEDIKKIEGIEEIIIGIENMTTLEEVRDYWYYGTIIPDDMEETEDSTIEPTLEPTIEPTQDPSTGPTAEPTPTATPTPTKKPTPTPTPVPIQSSKKVYNVLLIGVDRRNSGWAGNSDSMILMSLNYDKKQISMISLMRDTYVSIPRYGMRKLNAAHAIGAGPLLLKTVEQNFRVDVDRYATVDFSSLATIIDRLGGITLNMSAEEVGSANGNIYEQCSLQGLNPSEYYLSGSGSMNCNGIQAVAYARIRNVGNYDYQRTERQRTVLTKMMEKFQTLSVSQMMDFAKSVLPLVTHNIPESEIWDLVGKAPSLLQYSMVKDRVPYSGLFRTTYVNGQSMLVPSWDKTIKKLQNTLY